MSWKKDLHKLQSQVSSWEKDKQKAEEAREEKKSQERSELERRCAALWEKVEENILPFAIGLRDGVFSSNRYVGGRNKASSYIKVARVGSYAIRRNKGLFSRLLKGESEYKDTIPAVALYVVWNIYPPEDHDDPGSENQLLFIVSEIEALVKVGSNFETKCSVTSSNWDTRLIKFATKIIERDIREYHVIHGANSSPTGFKFSRLDV